MKRNDSILQNYYMSKLPKFQQRRGQVSLSDLAQKLELEKRIGKNVGRISTPAKQSNVLTQLSPEEIYYANQLNKYGRTKEDIERSRREAELPFLLATGAIAAPLAGLGVASAAPAIGAGLSYAPIASAPGATLGNLLTSAGIASAITNLPNTGRSVGQAVRTGNINDIREAVLNVGLTGLDLLPVYPAIAKTARNVAQHPLVSTLPYIVQNRAVKDYAGAAALAAINRAAPILSKAPVLKDIYKGAAERIASSSLGQTRDLSQIIRALRGKNFKTFEGSYKGMTSTPASGYSTDRNLVRNYIYGDTRGFEQSDIPLINLNKYINRYGPLKKYKLDASQLQDEDYPFEFLAKEASWNNTAFEESLRGLETPEEIIDKLKEIARREGMVGIGSESNNIGFDDIAGHMKYLIHDPVTDTYKVRTQDIWKFTPEDYNPKWLSESFDKRSFNENKINLKTYLGDYMKSKQASLMDKAGKPFVTLDERPLAITKRPERTVQSLDIKLTDYTPQELEEMGLSTAEIKDVLAKSELKLSDWDLSKMTDFSKPLTGFSNKIKDLNFADLVEKKSRLKRKQGGSLSRYQGTNGSGLVLQQRYGYGPTMGDLATQSGIPTQAEVARQAQIRKEAAAREQQLAARARYNAMPKIGPAKQRNYSEQVAAEEQRRRLNQQYADQNPEVTVDDSGDIVPSGYGRFMQTYGPSVEKFGRSLETPLGAMSLATGVGSIASNALRLGASALEKKIGRNLVSRGLKNFTGKVSPVINSINDIAAYAQLDPVGIMGNRLNALSYNPTTALNTATNTITGVRKNLTNSGIEATDLVLGENNTVKLLSKEVPELKSAEDLVDLYRVQEKGFDINSNTIAEMEKAAAEGRLNAVQKMILNNPYDRQRLMSRDKFWGRWFEKEPKRLEYYIKDKGDNSEILHVRIPRSKAPKYSIKNFEPQEPSTSGVPLEYHQKMSLSPETEFILPKDIIQGAKKYSTSDWEKLIREHKPWMRILPIAGASVAMEKKKEGGPIVNSNGYKNGRPPKGSNWRIPSDTLYNPTPHKLLAISDKGEAQILNPFDNRLKKFTNAEYVDEYEMREGGLPKFQQRPGTYRPLNELTDAEKRNLAKRIVTNARRRIETKQYFPVPESLKKTKEAQEEGAYGCIGGCSSIYAEEGVIPKAIWSNTDFSLLAPELGFPNSGWGLRGIENLEPGDIIQWMDTGNKNQNKAYPHHAQIFLGVNPETGEYEFFDNYAGSDDPRDGLRTYSKEQIENRLKPGKKEYESQAQIYKVNPYSLKTDPTTRANIRKRQKENIEYEINNPIPYEYSLTPDSQFRSPNASGNIADPSPIPKDLPEGVQKYFEFVNNPENTKNLLKKLGELKYFNRATNEDLHDSYLNVFGILGQENKWADRWFGGSYGGLENTGEKILKPKNASLGPGQIKFSDLPKEWRKEFGIKSPKDLYKWEKILPLMTVLDVANKQWMQNQGENFSERIVGTPGLASNEMKWSEGRLSPYFYRGPGVRNVRDNLRERYVKNALRSQITGIDLESMANFGMGDSWQNETDNIRWDDPATEYVEKNIRKEQKVFDPGSYGRNVWENWARNIQRQRPVQYKQTIPARQIYNEATKQWENIPAQEPIPLMLPEVVIGQKKLGGLTKYQSRPAFENLQFKLGGKLTPNKAREILHRGMAHGNKLTDKQRRYFGFMSKGNTKKY